MLLIYEVFYDGTQNEIGRNKDYKVNSCKLYTNSVANLETIKWRAIQNQCTFQITHSFK